LLDSLLQEIFYLLVLLKTVLNPLSRIFAKCCLQPSVGPTIHTHDDQC